MSRQTHGRADSPSAGTGNQRTCRLRAVSALVALVVGFVFGCMPVSLAEPLVVGFERFHASAPSAEGGRLLFNELGCANCHAKETALPPRKGPVIQNISHRINASWLREYLLTPDSHRSGATMPRLFENKEREDVEAVIHYLSSLKPANVRPLRPSRHTDAERGQRLFHTMGCVACHEPEPEIETSYRSVPFPDFKRKYSLTSLTEFLKNPLVHRPLGRMPQFDMTSQDANDLAGYLMNHEGSDPAVAPGVEAFSVNTDLIKRGRAVVTEKRCAACHDLPTDWSRDLAVLGQSSGGCLNEHPPAGLPKYSLSELQRESLRLFLANETPSTAPETRLTLTQHALNCLACHERDGVGGPDAARRRFFAGNEGLGDSGKFPPPLTGAGHKLQTKWLQGVLKGTNRVRPYLKTRMPFYGRLTDGLAEQFAAVDSIHPKSSLPEGDAEAGRKLLGTEGGNSCITCHRWGARDSLGIPGMDIRNMAGRLNADWLHDYLVNPGAYRPNTLMPSFWPDGHAANRDILDGDTEGQIASIIAFAKDGEGEPLGFPEVESDAYELIPKHRPIVLRTFMENVGTHAILVGFPEGTHLAYDGLNARPALAWRGRFFNGYNTWFSRFAPFEKPLGEAIVAWPENGSSNDRTFMGYRLDGAGVPTFLWSVGKVKVEERFESTGRGLVRTLRCVPNGSALPPVRHPEGVQVTEIPTPSRSEQRFIYEWQ